MSIFSKKDKSTNKKSDSEKDNSQKEGQIDIIVKEKSKTNKIQEKVDEVYPWMDQKKIDKPGADDFPTEKYVAEPKWKHPPQTTDKKENIPKKEILEFDKENKIEEPKADDFPTEKYVAEPKWKHPSQTKKEPIVKASVSDLKVKESSKPITTNREIEKPIIRTDSGVDSLSKLKELANKKEISAINEGPSGQKLGEMLRRELSKKPISEPVLKNEEAGKITNTKLGWLKDEIIEKPKADDFLGPKSFDETKSSVFPSSDNYSWMKKEKIEMPLETDFAAQTKEAITNPNWKSEILPEVHHPKWIHENNKIDTSSKAKPSTTQKTIKTVTEPKWKKDTITIKKKKTSLKTPIDDIFELLESYKQADTGELAKYTNIDAVSVEKMMRVFEDYGIVEVRYPTSIGKKPVIRLKKEVASKITPAPKGKILESYEMTVDFIPAKVSIILVPDEARPIYNIDMPTIGKYTRTFLTYIKNEIAETLPIELDEITNPTKAKKLKERFFKESKKQLSQYFPIKNEEMLNQISGVVLHEMYGLGDLEVVMGDDMLEEVAINSAKTPVTVYHRIHGWLKTNLLPGTEEDIMNYSSQIGRKIGREINVLSPILDAHLLSGDRVNATLFPISAEGNTLTIRRFARKPWTIVDFIGKAHTMNTEMAALLWLAMQYELNILISGGTASGKTSTLNTLLSLVPSYHRIISIEDVRELVLPKYLAWNWIPMITRSSNPEGLGEVTMLDCMITSLRMRPDRIIVGEIRRKREAEVLMEAIETGHSIYSTVHANSAYQVLRRLAESPMSIPPMQIELIDLIVVQYRDRKTNRRRTYEISEIEQTSTGKGLQVNTIYKWSPRTDSWEQLNRATKLLTLLNMHTGLTEEEIEKELDSRKVILEWLRSQNINELNQIGFVMKLYYSNAQRVLDLAKQKTTQEEIGKMME